MYDEAKRYGEALTMAYTRSREVDARVVRIFNTYGPHSDPYDGRIVPNFITQALRGEPITVYGDGMQTRSLCYIRDLIEGLVRMMESEETRGEVVNLGNPEEHAVLEYAELIRDMTDSRSELIFTEPAVGDDPQRRCPSIEKARRLLGWQPEVSLRSSLSDTVEYFQQELSLSNRERSDSPSTAGRA